MSVAAIWFASAGISFGGAAWVFIISLSVIFKGGGELNYPVAIYMIGGFSLFCVLATFLGIGFALLAQIEERQKRDAREELEKRMKAIVPDQGKEESK